MNTFFIRKYKFNVSICICVCFSFCKLVNLRFSYDPDPKVFHKLLKDFQKLPILYFSDF